MMRGTLLFIRLVVLTVILCLAINPACADRFPDSLQDHLNHITALIYNEQFVTANASIDSLPKKFEHGPLRHLFRAALLQLRMKAQESDEGQTEFYQALDSLEKQAKAMLSNHADSALAYYYLGHGYAFRSLHKGLTGHTWAAIKGGLAARKAYSKGYKIDSTFHDIALGLGSYRYWKSVKTKMINWTPLFKNEKANGIELLLKAVDSSEISQDAARTSLIMVYINEKRYVEAIRLSKLMENKYPHGLTFLWAKGEAFFKLRDYPLAAGIYEKILDRLWTEPGNCFNIIEAAWYLNRCYQKIEKDSQESNKMTEIRNRIRTLSIPESTKKRQKKRLREIWGK